MRAGKSPRWGRSVFSSLLAWLRLVFTVLMVPLAMYCRRAPWASITPNPVVRRPGSMPKMRMAVAFVWGAVGVFRVRPVCNRAALAGEMACLACG